MIKNILQKFIKELTSIADDFEQCLDKYDDKLLELDTNHADEIDKLQTQIDAINDRLDSF